MRIDSKDFFLILYSFCVIGATVLGKCEKEFHYEDHEVLCRMLEWLEDSPETLAKHITETGRASGHLLEIGPSKVEVSKSLQSQVAQQKRHLWTSSASLPVVLAHGMGDSCFNSGMQYITDHISKVLGVYAVCIPTGATQAEDTNNGYFLNMDASVEVFANGIKGDPKLQDGFYALGFSQGNNVIRGYIAKHNEPTVRAFISVNGVNAGEGAVPYCRPSKSSRELLLDVDYGFSVCDLLMEQASQAAYTEFAQEHNFQANYWRDPRPAAKSRYQEFSQLAVWNNEAGFVNETLKSNWRKTESFVWVKASEDRMVWPKEGEHWGAPDPNNPFENILPMKETEWYKQDLFGLRTADEEGRNYFETFSGDHLQFTEEELDSWILKYFN